MKGGGFGLIGDVIVGILGAVIAGALFPRLGLDLGAGILGTIIAAAIGACLLLFLLRIVRRGVQLEPTAGFANFILKSKGSEAICRHSLLLAFYSLTPALRSLRWTWQIFRACANQKRKPARGHPDAQLEIVRFRTLKYPFAQQRMKIVGSHTSFCSLIVAKARVTTTQQ